jgi:hypothetical protein
MLQVGMIGIPNAANHSAHRTQLTPDEQYTQVSLWCLLSAPLLLSRMDAFRLLQPCGALLKCQDFIMGSRSVSWGSSRLNRSQFLSVA